MTNDAVVGLLRENPRQIAAATAGLTASQLRARPGHDDWSIVEILAHVRSCADVWGDCMRRILVEDRPTLRAVNPRTWIRNTNYGELEFRESFEAFVAQRARLLQLLEGVPAPAWSRSATVTGAGTPLKRTIRFYAEWLATHERSHVKQIERLAAVPPIRSVP